jgi:hypothetical protein
VRAPPVKVVRPCASDGSLYACPCCGHRTLEQRGADEICHDCYWQDEGQDDPVADEVWGRSNGNLSLTQARDNFRQCGAYDPRIGRTPIGAEEPKTDSGASESGLTAAELRKRRRPRVPGAAAAPKPPAEGQGADKVEEPSYAEALKSLPPAPPPKPLPRPPRPLSAWTQPVSAQQLVRVGIALLVILVAATGIDSFMSGRLTREMLKDHGYYLWAHGKGHYQPEYLAAFARDPRFRQRYFGQPVDTLHPLFPALYGGAPSDPDRLRAFNPGHEFPPRAAGARFGAYWLDSTQRGRTYCALLVDGRIADFFFVERW